MYTETLNQIKTASIITAMHYREPGLRALDRKERAAKVRSLLKSLGIKGVSVTAPNYSMAQSINISMPGDDRGLHDEVHFRLEAEVRAKPGPYCGMVQICPFCKAEFEAKEKLEALILAAYPDLDDRSDSQYDHFDYCLSFN